MVRVDGDARARRTVRGRGLVPLGLALASLLVACLARGERAGLPARNAWWRGQGPVVPHETFPADCGLCHTGAKWQDLRADFVFDHAAETGVPLTGSHERAQCLRCHNDRGPVADFVGRGCAGCHEDVHIGTLGPSCTNCHGQDTWQPVGMLEMHDRSRFPLVGVHASTACRRCHEGAEVGRFVPTDVECLTCHRDDLLAADNPNHIGLGWVDNCNDCHLPTDWHQVVTD